MDFQQLVSFQLGRIGKSDSCYLRNLLVKYMFKSKTLFIQDGLTGILEELKDCFINQWP